MNINLEKKYKDIIVKELFKEQGFKTIMQVPVIKKIVVNIGAGDVLQNNKVIENITDELAIITGLRPIITKAKKSIASFKLRKGMSIGAKVTLRRKKMYHFLDKLINVVLPRVRDFRGLNKNSFDKWGNYSLGIKEQIIFPEIDYDKIKKIRGMNITIVTNVTNNNIVLLLLSKMGMPFRK